MVITVMLVVFRTMVLGRSKKFKVEVLGDLVVGKNPPWGGLPVTP